MNRGALCARGQSALQGLYNPDRFRDPDYIRAVGGILVREQMLLVISSARGDAAALSAALRAYGFILVP